MFNVIGSATTAITETTSTLNEVTTIFNLFNDVISEYQSINTVPPIGLLQSGKIVLAPSVSLSTISPPLNPLDSITSTPMDISLDACHLDTSVFGTILKALMSALTMVINGFIDMVVDTIQKAGEMFMTIIESIGDLKIWFNETKNSIFTSIKETYNSFKRQMIGAKNNKDKVKEGLWKRAIKWFEGIMEQISSIIRKISNLVDDFIDLLEDARKIFDPIISLIGKGLGDITSDCNCIIKGSTVGLI